jgi:Tol biopolymer transport system component
VRRLLVSVSVLLLALPFSFPTTASAGVPAGQIVYDDAYGGSGLYTAPPDASGPTNIPGTDHALRPVWSPDGSGIAFLAHTGAIRWVDADGSNMHALLPVASLPAAWPNVGSIAWSPDGSQLVVDLYPKDYSATRLFLVTVADASLMPLLRNARQADWASTGQIAAVRNDRMITLDPDGSNLVIVVDTAGNSNPSWSPDGTAIAYMHRVHAIYDVFVVDADGSNRVNLTHSPQVDWSPTWSPDGSMIMWSRSKDVYSFANLFTMLADGSAVTRLTATDTIDEYEPDWTA